MLQFSNERHKTLHFRPTASGADMATGMADEETRTPRHSGDLNLGTAKASSSSSSSTSSSGSSRARGSTDNEVCNMVSAVFFTSQMQSGTSRPRRGDDMPHQLTDSHGCDSQVSWSDRNRTTTSDPHSSYSGTGQAKTSDRHSSYSENLKHDETKRLLEEPISAFHRADNYRLTKATSTTSAEMEDFERPPTSMIVGRGTSCSSSRGRGRQGSRASGSTSSGRRRCSSMVQKQDERTVNEPRNRIAEPITSSGTKTRSSRQQLGLSSKSSGGRRALLLIWLYVVLFVQDAVAQFQSVQAQIEALEEDDCTCSVDKCPTGYTCRCETGNLKEECSSTLCYEPVCPQGWWKCCYSCACSTCVRESFKDELRLSYRGVMECLPCRRGDYCSGCDFFQPCEEEVRRGPGGVQYRVPRISDPEAVFPRDCQRCPDGYEPDLWLRRCVREFRQQCDVNALEKCIDDCKQPFADECDRHQCVVDCAKEDENPECLTAFLDTCEELNAKTVEVQIQEFEFDPVLSTTAPPAGLGDDSGLAPILPAQVDYQCNVVCGLCASKFSRVSTLTVFAAVGIWLWGYSWRA